MEAKADPKPPVDPPQRMSTLEGVGSMIVVGGVLALAGTAVHPDMFQTFIPIGAVGCVGGVLVVRWARRTPRSR